MKHFGLWEITITHNETPNEEIIYFKGFIEDAEIPAGYRFIEAVNLYED